MCVKGTQREPPRGLEGGKKREENAAVGSLCTETKKDTGERAAEGKEGAFVCVSVCTREQRWRGEKMEVARGLKLGVPKSQGK